MKRLNTRSILPATISTRREFLYGTGSLAALLLADEVSAYAQGDKSGLTSYPFTLGVASGEPTPDGVVLWTRLAPTPLTGGWQSRRAVAVQYEVAIDPDMRRPLQSGTVLATPDMAHAVHVELRGLRPNRFYWYRFRVGSYVSPIGRTKTAPAPGELQNQFKFAFVSCSDYQNGYFAAYNNIVADNPDVIIHLGDYLYEYDPQSAFADRRHTTSSAGPQPGQLTTLSDYRNRHAQYKTDAALQELHRLFPWIVTWDDHETENNYANDIDEIDNGSQSSSAQFLIQRAAAYKAYYEHMPLRRSSLPVGPNMQLYRRVTFGGLAQFHVLDTRQYRSDQPNGDQFGSFPLDLGGTLLGDTQEQWLYNGIENSPARWNILAQQVMFAQFNFTAVLGSPGFNPDQWDGYGQNRQRILDFMAPRAAKNPVVITGDIHSAWAYDLKRDFNNPASQTVGTEFICTSVTADFPVGLVPLVTGSARATPHNKYFNGSQRGYTLCTLTPDTWRTDFRVVATAANGQVVNPNAAASTAASFVVQNGVPGAVRL